MRAAGLPSGFSGIVVRGRGNNLSSRVLQLSSPCPSYFAALPSQPQRARRPRPRRRRRSFSSLIIMAWSLAFVSLLVLLSPCTAQSPSTSMPVPPLQWIELTSLLSGPAPPPLKYASMGYDSVSHTLLIFGGEANGFPTQQTYL